MPMCCRMSEVTRETGDAIDTAVQEVRGYRARLGAAEAAVGKLRAELALLQGGGGEAAAWEQDQTAAEKLARDLRAAVAGAELLVGIHLF